MKKTDYNDYVACPFDPQHVVLKNRLNIHIIRCNPNKSPDKLISCPYNPKHLLKEYELCNHILLCKEGKQEKIKLSAEPVTPAPPHPNNEDSECWDDDPPIPSYDPEDYCKKNNIIRNLYGGKPSKRREFRKNERIRLQNLADQNGKSGGSN